MFCSKCGKELNESEKNCTACGKRVPYIKDKISIDEIHKIDIPKWLIGVIALCVFLLIIGIYQSKVNSFEKKLLGTYYKVNDMAGEYDYDEYLIFQKDGVLIYGLGSEEMLGTYMITEERAIYLDIQSGVQRKAEIKEFSDVSEWGDYNGTLGEVLVVAAGDRLEIFDKED